MTKIQIIPWANGMGDLLRLEPMIRGLKERYPDSHISIFCNKNSEILSRNPFINQVFSIWCSRCDYIVNCNWGMDELLQKILGEDKGKYKELLGFHSRNTGTNQQAINEFLKLQEWELGFDAIYERRKHYNTNLASWFCKFTDIYPSDPKTRFYFKEEDEQFATDYIAKLDKPLVVVHPTSEGKIGLHVTYTDYKISKLLEQGNKDWQADKFIALIDMIKEKFHVIIIGSQKDKEILQYISSSTGCDIGLNSLFQNLALVKHAKCFIGVDSCPAHVALTCDTPSLLIMCEILYHVCYPIDPKVKHQYICEPETVKRISIDTVYKAFLKLITENK
jgi:ADP-heptose:LPS heptosyltransferase